MALNSRLEHALAQFIQHWAELATSTTLRELGTASDWSPTLAEGVAGHAYALWQVGCKRNDRAALIGAERWWRRANAMLARDHSRASYSFLRGSAGWGPLGVHAVGALIAHSLGRRRMQDAAIARFTADVRGQSNELYGGLAGALSMALQLDAIVGSPRVAAHADRIARRLLARPARRVANNAIAHGTPGVQLALLGWSRVSGRVLPAMRIAHPRIGDLIARTTAFQRPRSFCSGLAGYVHLWNAAFRVTGDTRWLEHARAAGSHLSHALSEHGPSLCCGLVGRAYALLDLARVDPAGSWYERAVKVGRAALEYDAAPAGLMFGMPALVCLATDLLDPAPAWMPLFGAAPTSPSRSQNAPPTVENRRRTPRS